MWSSCVSENSEVLLLHALTRYRFRREFLRADLPCEVPNRRKCIRLDLNLVSEPVVQVADILHQFLLHRRATPLQTHVHNSEVFISPRRNPCQVSLLLLSAMSAEPVPEAPAPNGHSRLEEFERTSDNRPPFILTYTELKLLGIAGVSSSSKL
jgi:hypothetical protein